MDVPIQITFGEFPTSFFHHVVHCISKGSFKSYRWAFVLAFSFLWVFVIKRTVAVDWSLLFLFTIVLLFVRLGHGARLGSV